LSRDCAGDTSTRTRRAGAMRNGTSHARRGLVVYQLVLILLALALVIWLVLHLRSRRVVSSPSRPAPTETLSSNAGLLSMPVKPQPREITFHGCPPEGDGGDPELNRLKNRVDEGNYTPVPFDSIARLPWPPGVENNRRTRWSASDRATVARWEGIPVAVEGYLAAAKTQGPESPNCHGADPEFRDWHLWLVDSATRDRSRSVVVEVTPRVRPSHPAWKISTLNRLVRADSRVRISGWLMLDPEHPEQLGKTRGTIWEIHPVMKIETLLRDRWVMLDSVPAGRIRP
jgi:hypothetical protein